MRAPGWRAPALPQAHAARRVAAELLGSIQVGSCEECERAWEPTDGLLSANYDKFVLREQAPVPWSAARGVRLRTERRRGNVPLPDDVSNDWRMVGDWVAQYADIIAHGYLHWPRDVTHVEEHLDMVRRLLGDRRRSFRNGRGHAAYQLVRLPLVGASRVLRQLGLTKSGVEVTNELAYAPASRWRGRVAAKDSDHGRGGVLESPSVGLHARLLIPAGVQLRCPGRVCGSAQDVLHLMSRSQGVKKGGAGSLAGCSRGLGCRRRARFLSCPVSRPTA